MSNIGNTGPTSNSFPGGLVLLAMILVGTFLFWLFWWANTPEEDGRESQLNKESEPTVQVDGSNQDAGHRTVVETQDGRKCYRGFCVGDMAVDSIGDSYLVTAVDTDPRYGPWVCISEGLACDMSGFPAGGEHVLIKDEHFSQYEVIKLSVHHSRHFHMLVQSIKEKNKHLK